MTTNDLHMPRQSAYKQNHSTVPALLEVKNEEEQGWHSRLVRGLGA